MKASSASANVIGPSAASMNGRRRPSGVWKVSLHGPITSGSVSAKTPSAASTSPTSVVDSVYRPRIGGRYAAVGVSAQASPSAPAPRTSVSRRAPPSGDERRRAEAAQDDVDDRALGTGDLLVAVGQPAHHPARKDLLESTVDDPARQARVELGPEHALGLTLLDHPLDH